MTRENDFFTPEQVDAQIERLTRELHARGRQQEPISSEKQVIEQLRLLYRSNTPEEDAQSLAHAWQRISRGSDAAPHYSGYRRSSTPRESRISMRQAVPGSTSTFRQRLGMLAAIAVVMLLVGSMAVIFSMAHNRAGSVGGHAPARATHVPVHATPSTSVAPVLGGVVYSYTTPFDIYSVAWSADSQRIVAASNDSAHAFDATTGRHVINYSVTDGNNSYVPAYGVAWSPDGKRIAASSDKVRIWDASSGKLLLVFPQQTAMQPFVPSPTAFALHGGGARTVVAELASAMSTPTPAMSTPTPAMSTPTILCSVTIPFSATQRNTPLSGGSPVWTTAWSPDGKLMATAFNGGGGNVVEVWNTTTGQLLLTYRGHTNSVNALSWSPDGKYIASASNDQTVQVWVATTGHTITTYGGDANAVSWSPDGKRIASSGTDVHIWNPMTGKTLLTYQQDAHYSVSSLSWSPDGKRIASGGDSIEMWDSTTGKTLFHYAKNTGTIRTLAWSPNGKYIVSAGGVEELGKITLQVWVAS